MCDHFAHVTDYVRSRGWPPVAIYTVGVFFLKNDTPDYTAEFENDSSILVQKLAKQLMLKTIGHDLYHVAIVGVRPSHKAAAFREMYNRYYPAH